MLNRLLSQPLAAICMSIVFAASWTSVALANNTSVDSDNNGAVYQALLHKNATWYGSTFWSGPDWTRVGKDWHHPGIKTPSVRRFVSPYDGKVTIGGRVYKADASKKGDGVRLIIRHGDDEVWRAEIAGDDTKGTEPKISLNVKRGDSIRFIVDKLGNIGYDTTHWDPVVSFDNGKRFRASEAFGDKRQGHAHWYYEMQTMARRLSFEEMIQADWLEQDKLTEAFPGKNGFNKSFTAAVETAIESHIAKSRLLLADLRGSSSKPEFLAGEAKRLGEIEKQFADQSVGKTSLRDIYFRLRTLKREIVLANPLMDFGPLLFCKRVPTSYSHLVMQYYGWRARPGGGLFVLENPGHSSAARDILDGKLAGGCVLEPRLSFDGKRIVFSYVEHAGVDSSGKPFDPYVIVNNTDDGFYHIWEVNVDGSGLRQLTSGPYDDLMPTYLPDG
ncbi:MAG: hypothetical protein JXM70_21390, partial [Pirellulales bacterium]|nr:hypothetical protein [Pirellulales bacterium]